jgi:hypothetical protein
MFTSIKQNMTKNKTHTGIQECIIKALQQSIATDIHQFDISTLSYNPSGILKAAIAKQNTIGWNNFYCGRLTKKNGRKSNSSTSNRPNPRTSTRSDGPHQSSQPCGTDSSYYGKKGIAINTDAIASSKTPLKEKFFSKRHGNSMKTKESSNMKTREYTANLQKNGNKRQTGKSDNGSILWNLLQRNQYVRNANVK